MKQIFGPKVEVSLSKSYHSADASKSKYLVFKGVSNNISINEFNELLDLNKITHAEAEGMKSKRSGKELPFIKIKSDDPNNISINEFNELLDLNKITHAEAEAMKSKRSGKELSFIKIKSDDPKQAEALLSGGLVCQKTGIIFRVEEFKTTPGPFNVSGAKILSTIHQIAPKTKNVLCVVKLIHTKTVQIKKKKPKCANCRGPDVANYKGCPAYKDQAFRQRVVQKQVSYASILKQDSPPPPSNTINFAAEQIVSLVKCGQPDRSATTVHQKSA